MCKIIINIYNYFQRENVSFSTIVFFETVLMDVIFKIKNVFNKQYVFVYIRELQRKPRDKGPGEAPGRRRRPMHKRVLTIDLKEYLFFSAGLIFETVLIDVRNQMKNVLDELYVIGLYKPRGKGVAPQARLRGRRPRPAPQGP